MDKFERAAKNNRGVYVSVSYRVSGPFGFNSHYDSRIIEIAKKFGGEEFSSGSGFGKRDINFGFVDNAKASKFKQRIKRWKTIEVDFDSLSLSKYFNSDDED